MNILRLRRILLDRPYEPRSLAKLFVVLLVLSTIGFVLGAYAIVQATGAASNATEAAGDAKKALAEQNVGRRIGQRTTCGALNAVISAGRRAIQSGADIDPAELDAALKRFDLPVDRARRAIAEAINSSTTLHEIEKFLRRRGLPPRRTLAAISSARAETYVHGITSTIIAAGGAVSVVRKDGLLDCAQLRVVTGVK